VSMCQHRTVSVPIPQCLSANTAMSMCQHRSVSVPIPQCHCANTAVYLCQYRSISVPIPQCHCANTTVYLCQYRSISVPIPQCHCANTAVYLCQYRSISVPIPQCLCANTASNWPNSSPTRTAAKLTYRIGERTRGICRTVTVICSIPIRCTWTALGRNCGLRAEKATNWLLQTRVTVRMASIIIKTTSIPCEW